MSNSEFAPALRVLAAALAGLVIACNPPIKQYELKNQQLSCDDANRLSYRTLEAMRFKVTEFRPATPGEPGVLKASRARSGEGEGTQHATVDITCTPTGADIEASEDGAFLNQVDFARAFHHAFTNVVSLRASRDALDQKIVAGIAPPSQQRGDLRVVVTPLRGQAGKLDFPYDLAAAGVLPVKVEITNLTKNTYTLDVGTVRLTRADRERIAPLAAEDAAAQVAAARQGNPPQPLTTTSKAGIADALSMRQLTVDALPPGSVREGFLYFPLADYGSARLVFTDKATGEDEGVRVEF